MLEGTEENSVSPWVMDLPSRQINDFSPKGNRKKELVDTPGGCGADQRCGTSEGDPELLTPKKTVKK